MFGKIAGTKGTAGWLARLSRRIGKAFWFYHIDRVLGRAFEERVIDSEQFHDLDDALKYHLGIPPRWVHVAHDPQGKK